MNDLRVSVTQTGDVCHCYDVIITSSKWTKLGDPIASTVDGAQGCQDPMHLEELTSRQGYWYHGPGIEYFAETVLV